MKKIYSRCNQGSLLHIVFHVCDFKSGRFDIIDPDQYIQCAALQLNPDKTFRAHKHLWRTRTHKLIAQESWVIIKGAVECFYYDVNNDLIDSCILGPGDASFTLEGGHNYKILENDSLIYEFKTGPYEGQSIDKDFIQ